MSEDVKGELTRFKHPQLWTFTVDPLACPDQLAIFLHLKRVRAMGELVKALKRQGLLTSGDYFWASEFGMGERTEHGQGTGQVHFHLVLDAKDGFLDHRRVAELWQRYKPEWANEVSGRPPGHLGWVQFEVIDNSDGIAIYVCKYLAKGPKQGLPEWFTDHLDAGHHCTLHGHSHDFWQNREKRKVKPRPPVEGVVVPKKKRKARTIAERNAACGAEAGWFDVTRWAMFGEPGWVKTEATFRGKCKRSFLELAEHYQVSDDDLRQLVILVRSDKLEFDMETLGKVKDLQ